MAFNFSADSLQIAGSGRLTFINEFKSDNTTINVGEALHCPRDPNSFFSTVPHSKVPHYVDRPALHDKLAAQLHARIDNPTDSSLVTVVFGLSGAGKTQLVLDYVQRNRKDYKGIIWIDLSSKKSLEQTVQTTYQVLYELSVNVAAQPEKLEETLAHIKAWFSSRSDRWLLLLDNADNVENKEDAGYININSLIPPSPSVHVIVTTRNRNLTGITNSEGVEVGSLEINEALSLFWGACGLDEGGTSSRDRAMATAIVEEVECLALAIELAGAAISEVDELDLPGYLEEYKSNRSEILRREPEAAAQYPSSILTAWETTFTHLQHRSALAAKLLGVLSFLDHTGLSLELFRDLLNTEEREWWDDWRKSWEDALSISKSLNIREIEEGLGALRAFSLVRYDIESKVYSMHKLVHEWAFERLQRGEERRKVCIATGDILFCLVQAYEESFTQQKKLFKHLGRYFDLSVDELLSISERDPLRICIADERDTFWVLSRFVVYGSLTNDIEQWIHSERIFKILAIVTQEVRGEDDEIAMSAKLGLSNALKEQGKFNEAAMIMKQVVERAGSVLGATDSLTLMAMSGLADLHHIQGEHSKGELENAISLQTKVVQGFERMLGNDHDHVLAAQGRLASMLSDAGRCDEAVALFNVVIDKREQIFGEEDQSTLIEWSALANTLAKLGMFDKAVSIQRNVVGSFTRIYGETYSETINALENLALTLTNQNKLKEAFDIQSQVLKNIEENLGSTHLKTLKARFSLTDILFRQNKFEDAATIQKDILQKVKDLFGLRHEYTIIVLRYLCTTLQSQGKRPEADSYLKDVLEERHRLFGEGIPTSMIVKEPVRISIGSKKEEERAEKLRKQVLQTLKPGNGENHPQIVGYMISAAMLLLVNRDMEGAAWILETSLVKCRMMSGEDTYQTVNALRMLSRIRMIQGRSDEAELLEKEALEVSEHIWGKKE